MEFLTNNAAVMDSLSRGSEINLPGTNTNYFGANPEYVYVQRPDPLTGAITSQFIRTAKGIPFVRAERQFVINKQPMRN